jgi:hypothetical protein
MYFCAASVTGVLDVDAAHKNKELNVIIIA